MSIQSSNSLSLAGMAGWLFMAGTLMFAASASASYITTPTIMSGFASGILIVELLTYGANGLFSHIGSERDGPNHGPSSRLYFIDNEIRMHEWLGADHDLQQYDRSSAIPAPATPALFCLGLAGLSWSRRKTA